MQFKHPELLYGLLLLLIPIIVHLFQLRRFQKEAFTNVKFLKEVVLQTRKSSQLKKWLTLLTRMGIIACAVLAFAQPYFANSESFNTKSETVIYLDNSFSMQAKGSNGTMLNKAIQDIIEYIPENDEISLFTNDDNYYNTTVKSIQNDLIQLKHSPKQLSYDAVVLKGKQAFSKDEGSIKHLVMVSDFQQQESAFTTENDSSLNISIVPLQPTVKTNISIDSAYVSKASFDNLELTVQLSNQGTEIDNLPVSLFNDDNLVAKSAVAIKDKANTVFTIPVNGAFNGKLLIEDPNLGYDNKLYFNIDKSETINVLSINEADDSFLNKLFTNDEFNYKSAAFNALNYNSIPEQNLIILNELKTIPVALTTALNAFTNNGGKLLIIPSNDISLNSYNQLFTTYNLPTINKINTQEKRITNINFSHPVLSNVFDKKVDNFQYPKVNSFYNFNTNSGSKILSYEDGTPFLVQSNNAYVFSASLNDKNSNFKSSPLIVPVLYNIGKQSLKLPKLYYTARQENTIDINTVLLQDDILTLHLNDSSTLSGNRNNSDNSVIPLQRTFTNKVELTTNEFPDTDGWIDVKNKDKALKTLSFNFDRKESNLNYLDPSIIKNVGINNSIASAIDDIKSTTKVNELWKWFVIFALAFLLIEMLLLKFLK